MRHHLQATAVSLCCLAPLGLGWTAPQPPPAKAPASAPASTPSSDTFAAQAAARHAKRTACLKEARSKRLMGAARDSYVKDCIAAP
jgi:hypothetical protein